MKKFFITLLLCSSLFSVSAVADNANINGDIEDWGVVVDGKLLVKVTLNDAEAVKIIPAGESSPVTLQNGVNTVKVPETDLKFTVTANEGYTIVSIKVGDQDVAVTEGAATVQCVAGKEVTITTKNDTSSATSIVMGDNTSAARYFDLSGAEVSVPKKGNIYVMLRGGKAVKIRK